MEIQQRRPSHRKIALRFIPQEVLEQLRARLHLFPDQIRRMVVLLLESGMRVNELCALPFDCLVRDTAGNWFLRYNELKTQNERTIPLSSRAASVIQEQQRHAFERYAGIDFLFPSSKGRPFSPKTFITQLNRLACERFILDTAGYVWRFQAHQFRYTLAAQMIRDNVPINVIQEQFGPQAFEVVLSVHKLISSARSEEKLALFPWQVWAKQYAPQEGAVNSTELLALMKNASTKDLGYCTLPLTTGPYPHYRWCSTRMSPKW